MTIDEFEAKKKLFGGMLGSSARLPLSAKLGSSANEILRSARERVLNYAFLSEIGGSKSSLAHRGSSSLSFAGYLPPSSMVGETSPSRCDVLVRLQIDSNSSRESARNSDVNHPSELRQGQLWVACDNVVFSNQLSLLLRKVLSTTGSE
jgi:hypothetical protein